MSKQPPSLQPQQQLLRKFPLAATHASNKEERSSEMDWKNIQSSRRKQIWMQVEWLKCPTSRSSTNKSRKTKWAKALLLLLLHNKKTTTPTSRSPRKRRNSSCDTHNNNSFRRSIDTQLTFSLHFISAHSLSLCLRAIKRVKTSIPTRLGFSSLDHLMCKLLFSGRGKNREGRRRIIDCLWAYLCKIIGWKNKKLFDLIIKLNWLSCLLIRKLSSCLSVLSNVAYLPTSWTSWIYNAILKHYPSFLSLSLTLSLQWALQTHRIRTSDHSRSSSTGVQGWTMKKSSSSTQFSRVLGPTRKLD